jgi:hypothetical protein
MSGNSPVSTVSRAKPRNVMRGLTPTVGIADNAASVANLANATDENASTFVDEATRETSTSGSDVTTYTFDLGENNANKVVDIGFLIQMKSSTGTMTAYVDQSANGSSWMNGTTQAAIITSATYQTKSSAVQRVFNRYVRIRLVLSGITGSQTCASKLGEVVGSLVV